MSLEKHRFELFLAGSLLSAWPAYNDNVEKQKDTKNIVDNIDYDLALASLAMGDLYVYP